MMYQIGVDFINIVTINTETLYQNNKLVQRKMSYITNRRLDENNSSFSFQKD